jgi:hypothetical protein
MTTNTPRRRPATPSTARPASAIPADTTASTVLSAATAAAIVSTPDPAPTHCAPVHTHVDTSHAVCDFGGGF